MTNRQQTSIVLRQYTLHSVRYVLTARSSPNGYHTGVSEVAARINTATKW